MTTTAPASPATAAEPHREGYFLVGDGRLTWTGNGEMVQVDAWGADSVRVRAAIGAVREHDWALLTPLTSETRVHVEGDSATLENGQIHVRLDADRFEDVAAGYDVFRCRITITDASGTVLLQEIDTAGSLKLKPRHWRATPGDAHRLTASFQAQEGERLYGMGLYQEGLFDLKGATLELAHRNSQASVPFVVSNRGYGMLWHNPAIGRVTFGANRTEWHADETDQLDYWVTAGASPSAITAAYADATGHAPAMPERGLGFWQCKLRYWNQEQLLQVAREHKRRGLPMDVIVADFFHWPHMGDYRFEEQFWPDPKAMVEELAALGIELMVSVWPQVSMQSENYGLLRQRNALARTERGLDPQMGFEGPSMFVDFTSPAGRELVWEACRRNYGAHGIRTFWLDEAEPEWGDYDFSAYRYAAGTVAAVGNVYPQQFSRAFFEGQRADGETEIVNLVRCAWAGSQRYGALVWSGDIHSTWTDLSNQVVAGVQMGLAGIPWFTTDIGGFHDGVRTDPAFRELLVRWFQFGAFCPVMRLHGDRKPVEPVAAEDGSRRLPSGSDNEVWSFGEEAYPVLVEHLHIRERLRPYLREVMRQAEHDGQPVMRALFHEFPDDTDSWSVASQFLLGGALLVAPVLEPGATSRAVHLPAGAAWRDTRSGEVLEGGQDIVAEAPIDSIPVYIRVHHRDATLLDGVFHS